MYVKTLLFVLVSMMLNCGSLFAFQNINSDADTAIIGRMLQQAFQAEESGELERAKTLIAKADSLSESVGYKEGLALALLRKANIVVLEQKFDSALTLLDRGIGKYSDTKAFPDYYVSKGNIYRTLGNCEEAANAFETALENRNFVPEKTRDEFIAGVNMNIGGCLEILGDYAGAIEKHLAALEFAQANADTSLMALSQMNIGNVYDEQQEIEKAAYYYENAIENARSINMARLLPGLYNNLALIREQEEKYNVAEGLYVDALEAHREMAKEDNFVQAIHNLGSLYRKMGEYDRAEEYLRKGLALSNQMKVQVGLYYGNIEMGYLYHDQGIYETSAQFLENARQIASDLSNHTFLSETNEDLYEVYKEAGNYEKALQHHEQFKELADSLNAVQQDNQLADLESKLELNRQTEINQLLEEKQVQQEAQIQFQMILIIIGGFILLLIGALLYTTRRLATERESLLEELKARKNELEEMNQSKDQVFAVVSHDLRSPLTSVQGIIELIRENVLEGEDLKRLINDVDTSIRENVNVIEDLLAWAKDQLSGFDLNLQEVELDQIAKDVLTTNSFMAIQKNVELKSNLTGETVFADPNAVRVILRNLISNAIKYSEKDGTVQVQAQEKENEILLSVEDDGVGIPKSAMNKIFKSNTWTREGTKNEKGSGFGLSMSKEFVERMDGKIWLESEEGKGTTFYVLLPKVR